MLRLIASGFLTASLLACGGAIADGDDDADLPDDFDAVAGALAEAEDVGSPTVDDEQPGRPHGGHAKKKDGHGHGEKGKHGKHGKHPKKKLFRLLDALDGARDGTIVIVALPAQVPAKLIEKLHAIDLDGDGAISADEARAARGR